jgi:anti-anti-sigma factor
MKVKIDTKEKFHVITVGESNLTANLSGKLAETCLSYMDGEVKNVILNMKEVNELEVNAAESILSIQQRFYENNCSFVVCSLNKEITRMLDENELLDMMNITPTESEAWDIVQMEEIERELLGGME